MLPPASPAAAAANAASPRPQPPSPSSSQLQSPFPPPSTDDGSDAALAAAYDCLHDPNKARDGAALANLLHSLGVTCARDLAHIDDAAIMGAKALLKPAAANFFAVAVFHAKGLPVRADIEECFAYLQDATKHVDATAMAALLQQLGVSLPHELQYLDDSHLSSIVALLKPVAAKVFAHMMACVRRVLP
jgi:hypothetical protein